MAKLKGRKFMIFYGSPAKAIAYATSHSLDLNAETSDSSTKDDGQWGSAEVTKLNWSASADAIIASDQANYDALFDAMISGTEVDIVLGIPSNYADTGVPTGGWTAPTTAKYSGKAIITSLTRNDAVGSDSTCSATFQGVGKLTKA